MKSITKTLQYLPPLLKGQSPTPLKLQIDSFSGYILKKYKLSFCLTNCPSEDHQILTIIYPATVLKRLHIASFVFLAFDSMVSTSCGTGIIKTYRKRKLLIVINILLIMLKTIKRGIIFWQHFFFIYYVDLTPSLHKMSSRQFPISTFDIIKNGVIHWC